MFQLYSSDHLLIKFFRFSLIGASALFLDFILLIIFIEGLSIGPLKAKGLSLLIVIFYTWFLNRNFTFKNKEKRIFSQMVIYYSFMLLGLAINYLIFYQIMVLVNNIDFGYLVASAIGSASTMLINFFNMQLFIFRNKQKDNY